MNVYKFSVTVVNQFIAEQSDIATDSYVFAYTITIKNVGNVAAQLISRHWVIVDANGRSEEVQGLGVVGQQPLLKPGEAFEYSSGTRFHTPTGTMHGSYFCVAEDGARFEVPIDEFMLIADTPNARVLH
ncbi:MAG TPA: Co2+/Mg2+ efflux protein ApaG [Burkholderiaceae bacterium]|nr:Co2+/Mg2+ efflux protein ApaG [Burkholderiaceae bacterium]